MNAFLFVLYYQITHKLTFLCSYGYTYNIGTKIIKSLQLHLNTRRYPCLSLTHVKISVLCYGFINK